MNTTKKKPTLEVFKELCNAKGGILSSIADALGRSRTTIYNWCKEDENFAKVLDDAQEQTIDLAETQLQALIKGVPITEPSTDALGQPTEVFAGWKVRPSETAIIFFLKTKGKKRGYVERQELDASVNMKGSINIREWVKDRLQKK